MITTFDGYILIIMRSITNALVECVYYMTNETYSFPIKYVGDIANDRYLKYDHLSIVVSFIT